jgi:hypothetical protein
MADAGCVLQADSEYDCLFLALALHQALPMQFGSFFLISVIRGETALMKSSKEGHLHVTRFLVESKANLEAKDNEYYTPYNMIFKSRAPLQFGSIFLISVIRGGTALKKSSRYGKLDVTRFLLDSKANLEATDE